jgi:predicted SprT family Zn-dependent metalloprotease
MLFGTRYDVTYIAMSDDHYGRCDITGCKIDINLDHRGNDTVTEQTFWHEVVHAILYRTGHVKLGKDEEFVDTIASCIHQVASTAIYTEVDNGCK